MELNKRAIFINSISTLKRLALWLKAARNGIHLLGSPQQTIRYASGRAWTPPDYQRVGAEQWGALLIERDAWRQHPQFSAYLGQQRKCVPKLFDKILAKSRSARLVQKLGVCPTTWEAQELSAFTKSPPVSKASGIAEKLVLSTRNLVQAWSFWVSCFFVDTRESGEKTHTFLLLWDLFTAKVKHLQCGKIQNTPKFNTCHTPATQSKPRISSHENLFRAQSC